MPTLKNKRTGKTVTLKKRVLKPKVQMKKKRYTA